MTLPRTIHYNYHVAPRVRLFHWWYLWYRLIFAQPIASLTLSISDALSTSSNDWLFGAYSYKRVLLDYCYRYSVLQRWVNPSFYSKKLNTRIIRQLSAKIWIVSIDSFQTTNRGSIFAGYPADTTFFCASTTWVLQYFIPAPVHSKPWKIQNSLRFFKALISLSSLLSLISCKEACVTNNLSGLPYNSIFNKGNFTLFIVHFWKMVDWTVQNKKHGTFEIVW